MTLPIYKYTGDDAIVSIQEKSNKPIKPIKTMKGLVASGKFLSDYLESGDFIDEEIKDFFIGDMPPIFSKNTIQLGEPAGVIKGHELYMTIKYNGTNWIYIGLMTDQSKRHI